ncbi:MAG: hypothetical protein GKR88_18040 [Flavobacteriaceae bacterium]|nr:MAG: hypothetical protein GKR88_18040 [Flavobacteriaceae bacterium]
MDRPKILAFGDVADFLRISKQRLGVLIKHYSIPHQMTSAGRVFFEEDIIAFQEARKDKMKYRRKKY